MFTLLVVEEQKGLWPVGRATLEEHRTLGVPWRLVRAGAGPRGPNWRKIERLAGRHRGRLISSTRYAPPAGSRVTLIQSHALERLLAARAMLPLLPRCGGTVGVLDPQARCLSAVEVLLERAECVLVQTDLPHRYEWFARRMLEQRGAPVVLCGSCRAMAQCGLVLVGGKCPNWQQWAPPGTAVFSAVGPLSGGGRPVVCSFAPACPPALLEQLPRDVPPAELCAALYRFAPSPALAALFPESCRLDGRLLPVGQLARVIAPQTPQAAK